MKVAASSVSGGNQHPGSWMVVFLCPHMAEGMREISWASFVRTLISLLRAPLMTYLLLTGPTSKYHVGD